MLHRARRVISATMQSAGEWLFSPIKYRERRSMAQSNAVMLALILLVAMAAILPLARDMVRWLATPDGQAAYVLWAGNKSIFDLVTGATTTLIAIGAVFLALRSYRVNQRAAVANRYQKGVELLSAPADSSKLGGIELLSVAAREAHWEYQEPVIRTLRQFLQERCAVASKAVFRQGGSSDTAAPQDTDLVTTAALSAVARTSSGRRWLEMEYDNEGLTLRGVYLHNVRLVSYDFSRIRFEEVIFGEVSFVNCIFHDTFIDARCFGKMTFHNCRISRFDILAANMDGERIDDAGAFIKMSRRRQGSDFRVNGRWVSAKD